MRALLDQSSRRRTRGRFQPTRRPSFSSLSSITARQAGHHKGRRPKRPPFRPRATITHHGPSRLSTSTAQGLRPRQPHPAATRPGSPCFRPKLQPDSLTTCRRAEPGRSDGPHSGLNEVSQESHLSKAAPSSKLIPWASRACLHQPASTQDVYRGPSSAPRPRRCRVARPSSLPIRPASGSRPTIRSRLLSRAHPAPARSRRDGRSRHRSAI